MTCSRSAATLLMVLWVLLESGHAVRTDCHPGETNYTTLVTEYKMTSVSEMDTKIVQTRSCKLIWWFCETRYWVQYYYVMKEKLVKYKISKEECCPGYSVGKSSICIQTGCLNGTYGDNCEHACSCPDNAYENCDQKTGICTCRPGLLGAYCTAACNPGNYGAYCQSRCECEDRATCNPRTGHCMCPPGWEGDFCENACTNETYGYSCNETCQCNLNQMCDHVTGECGPCKPGYSNPPHCDKVYPLWSFGQNCSQNCSCDPERTRACNSLNGTCDCKPGYNGTDCKHECPPGTYGYGCNERCENCTTGFCDHVNGSCYSCYGKTDPNCTEECPEDNFGFDCLSQCQCDSNHSNVTCDSCSGACHCHTGWTGLACDIECPAYMSDTPCQSVVIDNKCEPLNLTWACSDGWTGEYCTDLCEHGSYGGNCSSYCTCDDGQVCNPVTGECTCKSGYTGENCTTVCPLGTYGFKCSLNCTCNKKEQCHPVNGSCDCMFGWDGDYCAKALRATQKNGVVAYIWVIGFIVGGVVAFLLIASVIKVVKHCRKQTKAVLSDSHAELATRATEQHTMSDYRDFATGHSAMVEQDNVGRGEGASALTTSNTSDHPHKEDKQYADVDSEGNNSPLPMHKLDIDNKQNNSVDTSVCSGLEEDYEVIENTGVDPKALTSNENYCNTDENPVSEPYEKLDYEKDRCPNYYTSLNNIPIYENNVGTTDSSANEAQTDSENKRLNENVYEECLGNIDKTNDKENNSTKKSTSQL